MTVYFFVSDDDGAVLTRPVVKIGYSAGNTPRRVYDVGTGCPFGLKLYALLPGGKEREDAIHNQFAEHSIRKEWFWWVDEIAEWVDEQEHERPPNSVTSEQLEAFFRNASPEQMERVFAKERARLKRTPARGGVIPRA
jgi:hypothetical protein